MREAVTRSLFAACAVAALVAPSLGAGGPWYRAVEVGSLEGGSTTAAAINAAGQVTGHSGSTQVDPGSHAFRYEAGRITNLDPGFGWSEGHVIGPDGTVAGRADGVIMRCRPGEPMQVIGALGGDFGYVNGINASGSIAGTWSDGSSPIDWRAFVYTDAGGLKSLGTLGGPDSWAVAINDAGQVAGYSWLPTTYHAFRFSDGEMLDLGTLGGTTSQAADLNADGTVVGWAKTADSQVRAFRWTDDGGMQDLQTLADATTSAADVINDAGVIAGTFIAADGLTRAFRYTDRDGMVDLGAPPSETTIWVGPIAINQSGHIVGTRFRTSTRSRRGSGPPRLGWSISASAS